MNSKFFILYLVLFLSFSLRAQGVIKDTTSINVNQNFKFNYKQLIIPSTFIAFGVIGIGSDQLKDYNSEIKEEVNEHIDKKFTIDDISQYTPAIAALSLDAFKIKGKNSFKNKAIILTTSYLIMGGTVSILKRTTNEQRPDNTDFYSFPSGHTATAFAGAELLYQEYKDVNIWYGISGYLVATGTGAFRVYNDRHWVTDVVAGAGIGILSTKVAYWLFPTVNKLFKNDKETNKSMSFVPYYDGKKVGFGLISSF